MDFLNSGSTQYEPPLAVRKTEGRASMRSMMESTNDSAALEFASLAASPVIVTFLHAEVRWLKADFNAVLGRFGRSLGKHLARFWTEVLISSHVRLKNWMEARLSSVRSCCVEEWEVRSRREGSSAGEDSSAEKILRHRRRRASSSGELGVPPGGGLVAESAVVLREEEEVVLREEEENAVVLREEEDADAPPAPVVLPAPSKVRGSGKIVGSACSDKTPTPAAGSIKSLARSTTSRARKPPYGYLGCSPPAINHPSTLTSTLTVKFPHCPFPASPRRHSPLERKNFAKQSQVMRCSANATEFPKLSLINPADSAPTPLILPTSTGKWSVTSAREWYIGISVVVVEVVEVNVVV